MKKMLVIKLRVIVKKCPNNIEEHKMFTCIRFVSESGLIRLSNKVQISITIKNKIYALVRVFSENEELK